MPSFPPPNITIRSRIATALWPCLGLGPGPEGSDTFFHLIRAAMLFTSKSSSCGAKVFNAQAQNRLYRKNCSVYCSVDFWIFFYLDFRQGGRGKKKIILPSPR